MVTDYSKLMLLLLCYSNAILIFQTVRSGLKLSVDPDQTIAMVHCPSTIFKDLLLQNRRANQSQISYAASMGRGNESMFGASGLHDQDGRHAHIPFKNLPRN